MKKFSIAVLAIVAICLSACGGEATKTASVKPKLPTPTATATVDPSTVVDSSTIDTDGDGVYDLYDPEPNNSAVSSYDDDAPTEDDAAPKQTVKGLNEWGSDDHMKVKITSMEKVNSIPAANEYSESVVDKPGSSLVAVHMEVKNNGDDEIDPLCGGGHGFVLLDQKDRNFDPLDKEIEINDNVCSDGIQPGFKSSYVMAFRLPAGAKIGGLVVWNDDAEGDFSGEQSELLFTP
jgi:hypothetical protein